MLVEPRKAIHFFNPSSPVIRTDTYDFVAKEAIGQQILELVVVGIGGYGKL